MMPGLTAFDRPSELNYILLRIAFLFFAMQAAVFAEEPEHPSWKYAPVPDLQTTAQSPSLLSEDFMRPFFTTVFFAKSIDSRRTSSS